MRRREGHRVWLILPVYAQIEPRRSMLSDGRGVEVRRHGHGCIAVAVGGAAAGAAAAAATISST